MKIKEISTEQFGGIRNKSVSLGDGINVIYGKNESGKSTLVNVLSRTLFQDTSRSDKSFKDTFLPSKTGALAGDNIDGTVVIEIPSDIGSGDGDAKKTLKAGKYTLKKKWRKKGASQSLDMPSGSIEDPDDVKKVMDSILGFGEGVYTELLLSPQKDAADNLKKLFEKDKGKGLKIETTDALSSAPVGKDTGEAADGLGSAVTEAFSTSGSMPYDAFEQSVTAKITAIMGSGERWNVDKREPNKKANSEQYQQGFGDIGRAYLAREEAKEALDKYLMLENSLEAACLEYEKHDNACVAAQNDIDEFSMYADRLRIKKELEGLERELGQLEADKSDWKKASEELDKALKLKGELDRHAFEDIKELRRKWEDKQAELEKKTCPEDGEIKAVSEADTEIKELENSLRGINICAKFNKLPEGHTPIIRSKLTGNELDITAPITEAVVVEIPGIMEMELSSADAKISPDEANAKIAEKKEQRSAILGKHGVDSVKGLYELKDAYNSLAREVSVCKNDYERALNGRDYDELAAETGSTRELRDKSAVLAEIGELCQSKDITVFIEINKESIRRFTDKHTDLKELDDKIDNAKTTLENKRGFAGTDGETPEKYRGVDDIDVYLKGSAARKTEADKNREDALKRKMTAEADLRNFKTAHPDDLNDVLENCERVFNELDEELKNWINILKVFKELRKEETNAPLKSLANKFKDNLALISDKKVTSELADQEKLALSIASGDNDIDRFIKLSEGTKETVYLAFRLAVLDHLFPDGGGFIVLDDPLNDMDPERVKRSCELIKECAKRHQIIMLTCREDYSKLLDVAGKEIRI